MHVERQPGLVGKVIDADMLAMAWCASGVGLMMRACYPSDAGEIQSNSDGFKHWFP